jgi:hypothetical protein
LLELEGQDESFTFLRHMLRSAEFSIVEDQGIACLRVGELNAGADAISILTSAESGIAVLNGAAELVWHDFPHVKLSRATRVEDDGTRRPVARLTANRLRTRFQGSENDALNLIDLTSRAASDSVIEKALYLWGALDHDWRGLTMVLEVVKKDCGGRKAIEKHQWATHDELSGFSGTANSYEAAGIFARHAERNEGPPQRPMPLPEGERLVRRILVRWLEARLAADRGK